MAVYNARVTALKKESWAEHARQKRRYSTFHLRALRGTLDIMTGKNVQCRGLISCRHPIMLRTRRPRWLGHFHHMENGCITKDIMVNWTRRIPCRPSLKCEHVYKSDTRAIDRDTGLGETCDWPHKVAQQLKSGEKERLNAVKDKWEQRIKGVLAFHQLQNTLQYTYMPFVTETVGALSSSRGNKD